MQLGEQPQDDRTREKVRTPGGWQQWVCDVVVEVHGCNDEDRNSKEERAMRKICKCFFQVSTKKHLNRAIASQCGESWGARELIRPCARRAEAWSRIRVSLKEP